MNIKTSVVLVVVLAVSYIFCPRAEAQKNEIKESRKILMLISEGFYATEYYEPRALFEKAGFQISVAGKYADLVRPDRRQWTEYLPVKPDLTFDQVDVTHYSAVVFAGGNGAWEDFFPNEDVHKILSRSMADPNKITALLCSSTGLLGVANNFNGSKKAIAEGRHVTGYYRVEGLLRNLGKVNYDAGEKDKPHVVVDGTLITGRDPISAKLYGETILKALEQQRTK